MAVSILHVNLAVVWWQVEVTTGLAWGLWERCWRLATAQPHTRLWSLLPLTLFFFFVFWGGGWKVFSQISTTAGSFQSGNDLLWQWWPVFRWVWDAHSPGPRAGCCDFRAQTGLLGEEPWIAPVRLALATMAAVSKTRENLAGRAGSAQDPAEPQIRKVPHRACLILCVVF